MSALTRWEPTTRWNPFKELEEMEKRLSGYFGRTPTPAGSDKKEAISVAEWAPLVDISEDDKEYVIKAELPEMKKEEIKINVHDSLCRCRLCHHRPPFQNSTIATWRPVHRRCQG